MKTTETYRLEHLAAEATFNRALGLSTSAFLPATALAAADAARTEVNIGMIASWPSAEQYEAAAANALAQAARIRAFVASKERNFQPAP